ncbi:hypothetical protein SBY92_004208 [Candida maltosa Xu316]
MYIIQIENTGHSPNCLWKNFETPLNGTYYLRQHLPDSNDFLIKQYCKNLKNLIDNLLILQEYSESFTPTFLHQEIDPAFIHISNQWLLAKYFHDNKENFITGLAYNIPTWIYQLAVFGWSLNVQSYARDVILVMSCNMCNERVFLNTPSNTNIPQPLNLSSSKILTPVKYPMSTAQPDDEFETAVDCNKFDPRINHKPWCSHLHNDLPKYFYDMLLASESSIGPNGEYVPDNDLMNIDTSLHEQNVRKRSKSYTVNEGLERLTKLRKLYLIDE